MISQKSKITKTLNEIKRKIIPICSKIQLNFWHTANSGNLPVLKRNDVTKAGIFGSYAKGEQTKKVMLTF